MTEYLRRLLDDARVIELRHQHDDRWTSGRFDDFDALERAIRERADTGNLYTSLNRPADETASNTMGAKPLRDEDISTITRIVCDLDPNRPTGVPSTDAELGAALRARTALVSLLASYGWPTPALGMSGNGAHVVYRTRLKSTPAWRKAAAVLYAGLRDQLREPFAELGVTFDVTVRNPARIWRLYGTVNRKGEPTAERPHRTAEITLPRGAWQVIRAATIRRTIEALRPAVVREHQRAAQHRDRIGGHGDYSTLDVVSWFQAHSAYRRPLEGGKHAVQCPWENEHTTPSVTGTDTVIWETSAGGWPTFHCSHAHCDGRSLRDVIALWGDADHFCSRQWSRHG